MTGLGCLLWDLDYFLGEGFVFWVSDLGPKVEGEGTLKTVLNMRGHSGCLGPHRLCSEVDEVDAAGVIKQNQQTMFPSLAHNSKQKHPKSKGSSVG